MGRPLAGSSAAGHRPVARDGNRPCRLNLRYGRALALPSQPHSPIKLGASQHANTDAHHPDPPDSIPVGTDFIGGAAALPVRPAEPSQIVLGSDFAGGTVPLTAKVEDGEPAKQ
jgi:hypothetical protein